MLTRYPNKMLTPRHTKAPAPGAPRGRCPACGAVAPMVVSRAWGAPRPVVLTCRCPSPPTPETRDA